MYWCTRAMLGTLLPTREWQVLRNSCVHVHKSGYVHNAVNVRLRAFADLGDFFDRTDVRCVLECVLNLYAFGKGLCCARGEQFLGRTLIWHHRGARPPRDFSAFWDCVLSAFDGSALYFSVPEPVEFRLSLASWGLFRFLLGNLWRKIRNPSGTLPKRLFVARQLVGDVEIRFRAVNCPPQARENLALSTRASVLQDGPATTETGASFVVGSGSGKRLW